MTKRLYRMVEPLFEGEPVQYLGCYILKWGKVTEAEVGFVEAEDGELVKYLQDQGYKIEFPAR